MSKHSSISARNAASQRQQQLQAVRKEIAQNKNPNGAEIGCWDELTNLRFSIQLEMEVSQNVFLNALHDRSLFLFMPKRADAISAIATITSDLNQFESEFAQLGKLHEGRTGGHGEDQQQLYYSIELGEQYMAFKTRYGAVILPNVTIVTEQVALAVNERNARAAALAAAEANAAGATDPSVVTDVQVKEPVAAEATERTQVNVQLDANDPNPQATVAAVQDELVAQREEQKAI